MTDKRYRSVINKAKGCFVAAEISANHGRSIDRAVKMIKEAKKCGADAVKFQTYTPDTLTIDSDNKYFRIKHPEWGGQTLYELYKKAYTPWEWFKDLKKAADREGILFFSTAFDRSSVDLLEKLGVFCHKIASFEAVDLPLIEYASRTKKPVIISTGMATREEIAEAVSAARRGGAREIVLLKCVSSYPADPGEMNLRTIPDMAKTFRCPVGLSDHTLGTGVSVAAVAMGAVMVEKHFTLSRRHKTPDAFFSMEPREFRGLVDDIRSTERALGGVHYGLTKKQKESLVFRRSLFAVKDIKKGERFTWENVRSIRPANGLKPGYLKEVLGKKAMKNIKKGTPLRWYLVEGRHEKAQK